jgi:hypothetical protein
MAHFFKKSLIERESIYVEIFHCKFPKLLVGERYHVLFLTAVFIVQVTNLVRFT